MAEIQRYNGNVEAFASQAQGTERTVFGDTAQSDALDTNVTADWLRGWGIVGVNENPTKQDFNGLAFTISQFIAYMHQRGAPEWNGSQEYFDGSVVTTAQNVYRLKPGGDGSIDPDTDDGTNWAVFFDSATGSVSSVSNLRSGSFPEQLDRLYLIGYYGVDSAGGGYLYADRGDTTTADDDGSVFVDSDGVRWKREKGIFFPDDFGARGDGATDDTDACQAWIDYLISAGESTFYAKNHYLVSQLNVNSADTVVIKGGKWQMRYQEIGSFQHIFNAQNSTSLFWTECEFVGTSDSSATYDSDDLFGGILVQNSSFCGAFFCSFTKFTSYGFRANQLNGGTETEGVIVFGCRFSDFPYDAGTDDQCGVRLDNDGEYSSVASNWFFNVPSAARFVDGANSVFENNIVMELNGAKTANSAAFYSKFTSGGNGNKIRVSGNRFNHIETGQYIIRMIGDPGAPQNENIITDNQILVSGAAGTNNVLIDLVDCPSSLIEGNKLRPLGDNAGDGVIRVNESNGVRIDSNSIRGGDYALEVLNSADVYVGVKNQYIGQGTDIVTASSSSFKITSPRSITFRINSGGALGFGDTGNLSISKPGTGHYTVTHNFGTTDYSVMPVTDNVSPAPQRNFSVVRSNNSFDLHVSDGTGTAVDENVLVMLHLAQDALVFDL